MKLIIVILMLLVFQTVCAEPKGKPIIFETTAYEASARSCGRWAQFHKTYTGITPHRGIIAVDPRVIKLHSLLYVEGYGYGYAEDRGGAIQGYKLDVFMPTVKECMKWGRRKTKVWVIQSGLRRGDKGSKY
jgi:3D (Asp-Asp-Asp) domain-containing protein